MRRPGFCPKIFGAPSAAVAALSLRTGPPVALVVKPLDDAAARRSPRVAA